MPMPQKTFNDYGRDADFLMSEAPGRISREQINLAPTAIRLPSGTVLGQITATGLFKPVDPAATDGSQVAVAILFLGKPAKATAQRAVIVARQAEVAARMLAWPAAITASPALLAAAEQQLNTKTILVRH